MLLFRAIPEDRSNMEVRSHLRATAAASAAHATEPCSRWPVIEQPWQMMQHAKRNYCEADPFELFVE
jgi:hypothetical protein